METSKIFENEYRFCRILWAHSPIKSKDLVQLCAQELVDARFGGSLPAFVAAFTSGKKLSTAEIDQLQALIDAVRRD